MAQKRDRLIANLALATAGCLWGTGFFFGKIALREMSVTDMVLFRFAIASVGLLPVLVYKRPRFAGEEWGWLFASAVFGVPIQFLVQFKGLSLTTVSHAALMVGILPMLLAVAAVVFAHERLRAAGWVALGISTCGAAMIALAAEGGSGEAKASASGDLLVVVSMLAATGWILTSKHLMHEHPPLIVTAFVFWMGTVLLLIAAASTSGIPSFRYSLQAWGAVAAQGLFATAITTVMWNWGLKRVPASHAGIYVNLEPVVGAILGVSLLHESLGAFALAGGTLIVGAAVYLSWKPASIG
jgi:drug/metabolite transporter (DMT)-like permease